MLLSQLCVIIFYDFIKFEVQNNFVLLHMELYKKN
jgi:hypothetical protein